MNKPYELTHQPSKQQNLIGSKKQYLMSKDDNDLFDSMEENGIGQMMESPQFGQRKDGPNLLGLEKSKGKLGRLNIKPTLNISGLDGVSPNDVNMRRKPSANEGSLPVSSPRCKLFNIPKINFD